MNKNTVMETRHLDLCVSCGICVAVCPEKVVSMEFGRGQFLPSISSGCTQCGLCFDLCPGIDILPQDLALDDLTSFYSKNCIQSFTASANDLTVRMAGTSGGIITSLILNLIKDGRYDEAFILPFSAFNGAQAKVIPSDDPKEILHASKSKYIPVSVENVIEAIKKRNSSRMIVVATGCEIFGIKKFLRRFKYSEENILFLGLFCEKTLNFNVIRWFGEKYARRGEKIKEFHFRSKEKSGWPGGVKILFDSGRKLFLDSKTRSQLKEYFQLNRCLFCVDKLNYLSDIAFGDCYVKGEENPLGRSSMTVRTVKGMDIIKGMSSLFSLKETPIGEIVKSQHLTEKELSFNFIKMHAFQRQLINDTKLSFAQMISLKAALFFRQILIQIGAHYQRPVLDMFVMMESLRSGILKSVKKNAKYFYWLYCCFVLVVYSVFRSKRKRNKIQQRDGAEKENILIVGGELFNKGSQAMTFAVVDQMKQRFPSKKVILLSGRDYDRPQSEKEMYAFGIYPWDRGLKLFLLGLNTVVPSKKKYIVAASDLAKLLNEVAFVVDISGYALSSQWRASVSFDYLCNIAVAEKFDVPYYIFPQSMGPFDYDFLQRPFFYPLLKHYLAYPLKIFVREKDGYEHVLKFTRENVELRNDIVLSGGDIDSNHIYLKRPDFRFADLVKGSIGIIPNQRVVERVDAGALFSIYEAWITKLLKMGRKIYLLRHSYEDLQICSDIKARFNNSPDVVLLSDDFNAIEIEHIIKQFDFVIASRYHSIVHAYKNGVPAIALGWAVKYKELLQRFSQEKYLLDCRQMSEEAAMRSLVKMMENETDERVKIRQCMDSFHGEYADFIISNK